MFIKEINFRLMKNQNWIIILFAIIWVCKPIPYEDVVRNQILRQEVLHFRGGGQDSTGDVGGGNYNDDGDDLPKKLDPANTISDQEFWNGIEEGGESEDESQPAEAPNTSPPTGKLTRETIKNNDHSTKQIDPIKFSDWEGDNRIIKSRELKKSVCGHGPEAGVVSPEDIIPCPVQTDPTKYQRKECARITDEGLKKFANKIIYLGTSRKPGMIKFEIPMPYYDTEKAIGHMDLTTGDCVFFHKKGKYWSYMKYEREQMLTLIGEAESISLKLASDNSGPKSEL